MDNITPNIETPEGNKKLKLSIVGFIFLIIIGILIALFVTNAKIARQIEKKIDNYKNTEEVDSTTEEDTDTDTGNNTQTSDSSGISAGSGSTATGALSYSEDYSVTTKKDIVYGTGSGMNLKIDIYTPNNVSNPTPLVLYIHGGGFKGGSKNGVADDALMLAKHGTAVVAIDYRLSGTAVFPAPLNDIKGVARYMKAHANDYNVDPNAFFTLGESAGGVLASLMGVTEGNTTLEGTIGGNNGYNSNIAGVINISGSYVASIVDTMSGGIKNSIGNEVGCSPVPSTECEDEYKALSAETYITSGDSPFLILHGDKDRSVPTIQATTLDQKLSVVGVPSDIYVASDLAHVGGLLARYLDEVISFINTNS